MFSIYDEAAEGDIIREAVGKGNISQKVIQDSISSSGKRITTFELEYPRFVHAELMTHRLFSRNAASSRAIPVPRMLELVRAMPAMPVFWGKNQAGMQAVEECDAMIEPSPEWPGYTREEYWAYARDCACEFAEEFNRAGYHKQIVNRMLEPFQMMKVVVTATEWANWFYLRDHKDAQPEIAELAKVMNWLYKRHNPVFLRECDWHVPYFDSGFWIEGKTSTPLADALAISTSCCAQVSYRKLDDSLEKARELFDRLITSKPAHASPCEHQAKPMFSLGGTSPVVGGGKFQEGVTSLGIDGQAWSGNFKGWIQHRQLIPETSVW